jgi:serine/threonine protein kinase
METDGRASFTKRYAAPEVVKQDLRGRPADIFPLGCVYYELLATLHPAHISPLYECQSEDAQETSYQASIPYLQEQLMSWKVTTGPLKRIFLQLKRFTHDMIHEEPSDRLTADEITGLIGRSFCCEMASDELEALGTYR